MCGWRAARFGESFLLGGQHASFLDLITRVGVALGRPTPKRALPASLLRIYARAAAGFAGLTGRVPEITPEAAAFTCHDLRVDSGKAIRELGYRETELGTLLADTLAWLRAQGMLKNGDRYS